MKTKLMIAAVAALGAGAAFAAGPMKNADNDGDGYVSLAEAKAAHAARVEEHFAKADTDGDGLLSEAERKAAHKAKREKMKERRDHRRDKRRDPENIVERLDVDGSGSVSMSELEGRRFAPDAETFTAADTNGNGELDAAELGAMMQARRSERSERWKRSKD
ncbi:MAG: EF-hand domain-containing protein [Gammaproteobacteria bacterium]|nr:EF-hand domain-containing protein [Gammaproteobacteria bacterium]